MTRSLLDTDIFSEVMKGRNANVVRAAREYLAAHDQLTISAVTVMEVSYGLRRAGRTEQLAAFEAMLPTIEVLPLGDAAGLLAGHMKADLDARGTPIGASDVMIAAVAITSSCAGSCDRPRRDPRSPKHSRLLVGAAGIEPATYSV
jgi:tRNA(fMet)-specific endonuclease VapC